MKKCCSWCKQEVKVSKVYNNWAYVHQCKELEVIAYVCRKKKCLAKANGLSSAD